MNEDGQYANEQEMLDHLAELTRKYARNMEWEQWSAKLDAKDALEERMDIIGQNGNDGLHYQNSDTPTHYNKDIQPWDYMESIMSEEAFTGFLQGNVIKYMSRFEDKGGRADLIKARHYINKLLSIY